MVRVHCDNKPCDQTTPEDTPGLAWLVVQPMAPQPITMGGPAPWQKPRHFCSLLCLLKDAGRGR